MKSLHKWFKKTFIPHEGNRYHPHILKNEIISVILLVVIIVEIGFFVQIFYVFDKTKFLAAVLPGVLTSITNEERQSFNLPPLKENPLLSSAAQLKAEDMAKNGYFAHTSPEGKTPWYWFDQVGYKYLYAGENLAVNFYESIDVSEAWMESPTHKANILKANYTEIGIGVAKGVFEGRNTVFVAQLFGTPAINPPTVVLNELPNKLPEKETTELAILEQQAPRITENIAEEITPVNVVLGEESTPALVSKDKISDSSLKSAIREALTSPGRSLNYFYGTIGIFIALAISLVMFIRKELRHPEVVARGAGILVVILVLSFVNLKILESAPKIPVAPIGANAIESINP